MPTQNRIRIVRDTRLPWLVEQVRSRDGMPFTIIGRGTRARHLLDQLAQEVPDLRIHRFGGYEYMAFVGPEDPPAVILPGD